MPQWKGTHPEIDEEYRDALVRLGNDHVEFKGQLGSARRRLAIHGWHPQELPRQGPVRCVGLYYRPWVLYRLFPMKWGP